MSNLIQTIKLLRELTGAGVVDCKQALLKNSNFDEAAAFLRRKKIAKIADVTMSTNLSEGIVQIASDDAKKRAAIIEVNCETDFVARNSIFQTLVQELGALALSANNLQFSADSANLINSAMSKLNEKICVRRHAIFSNGDFYGSYIHGVGTVGALVEFQGEGTARQCEVAKQLAMHVVALDPLYLSRHSISLECIAAEEKQLEEQFFKHSNSTTEMKNVISEELEKYYSLVCLLEQKFIKNNIAVKDLLNLENMRVSNFIRYKIGNKI